MTDIDWSRLAVPQDDGYDTEEFARRLSLPTGHTGQAAVRPSSPGGLPNPTCQPAPVEHPNIPIALALLARWPTVARQFHRLISVIHPYSDPGQARLGALALGSCSHSRETEPGVIHVTVDDYLGAAQGMAHEMAHLKLRALGVDVERATGLILNSPDQLYTSPIRKDRPRPMTAVFHAQYSFMHVTALDLWMLDGATDSVERQKILMLLVRNVPRMRDGAVTIGRELLTDAPGRAFVDAFTVWSEAVLARGAAALQAEGYGSQ